MACLCPMALDPMVGHPGDVWTLLLAPYASCAPSCAHLSSPDFPPKLWRICQGLSMLDFAPEPDARLGCGPGGPLTERWAKPCPVSETLCVSRESGHRWRRLGREGTMLALGSKLHPTLLVSWGPGSDTILFLSQPHKHAHSHPLSSPPRWLWAAGRAHWAGALPWFLSTHSVVSGLEGVLPQCALQPSAVLLLSVWGSPGPLDTIAAAQAWLLRGPETPPSPAWPALPAQQPCWTTPFTRPHPRSSRILGSAFLCLS